MAISKTSSLNITTKQPKQPVNEMMESIKSATSTETKVSFRNMLKDKSFSAIQLVSEKQIPPAPRPAQRKETAPAQDSSYWQKDRDKFIDNKIPESPELASPQNHQESEIDDRIEVPVNPKESRVRDDNKTESTIQEEAQTVQSVLMTLDPGLLSSSRLPERGNPNLLQTSINAPNDQEIENWIQSGRVRIERMDPPASEFSFEQATPFPLEMLDQRSETQARLINRELSTSSLEELSTTFELNSSSLEEMTSSYRLNKKVAEEPSPSRSQGPSPVQPQATLASVAIPQDQEVNSSALKAKGISILVSGPSNQNTIGLMRDGAKVQKAANLTTLDKLNALHKIKDQLRQTLRKGETHLNIQLKPYELGRVEIKLDISRDGIVFALFKAENRETLEVLNRHSQDFQNLFKESGLQADSQGMNFSMSHQQKESPQSDFRSRDNHIEREDEKEMIPPVQARSILSTSSIDISV